MRRRFPRTASVLAAALLIAALPAVVHAAPEDAPVLWAGVVKASNGTPSTDAEVVAYARPSENELQPGTKLLEVARTTSDNAGRFTLRAPGGGAMAASADPGGWTTVMVIATGSAGTSVAVDSVAWQPLGGVQGHSAAPGRWITDPADLTSDQTAVLGEGPVPTTERPDALVLSTAGRAARSVVPFGGPTRAPGSYCMLLDKRDLGKQPVTIGHMHMERDWTGHFVYTNTRTTSVEVGVSMDGGTFTGQGSRTLTAEAEAGGDDLQDGSTMRNRWYQIAMSFTRYHWRCNEFSGTFEAHTIEPSEAWDGTNTYYDDSRVPGCNRKHVAKISPRRDFQRRKGSGTHYSLGFSAGGFTGSTSVATSEAVDQKWYNAAPHTRSLCGETAAITHVTRVRSQA